MLIPLPSLPLLVLRYSIVVGAGVSSCGIDVCSIRTTWAPRVVGFVTIARPVTPTCAAASSIAFNTYNHGNWPQHYAAHAELPSADSAAITLMSWRSSHSCADTGPLAPLVKAMMVAPAPDKHAPVPHSLVRISKRTAQKSFAPISNDKKTNLWRH